MKHQMIKQKQHFVEDGDKRASSSERFFSDMGFSTARLELRRLGVSLQLAGSGGVSAAARFTPQNPSDVTVFRSQ